MMQELASYVAALHWGLLRNMSLINQTNRAMVKLVCNLSFRIVSMAHKGWDEEKKKWDKNATFSTLSLRTRVVNCGDRLKTCFVPSSFAINWNTQVVLVPNVPIVIELSVSRVAPDRCVTEIAIASNNTSKCVPKTMYTKQAAQNGRWFIALVWCKLNEQRNFEKCSSYCTVHVTHALNILSVSGTAMDELRLIWYFVIGAVHCGFDNPQLTCVLC